MGDGAPFSPASAIFAAATEEILESYRDALHQSRNLADGRDYRSLHDICRVLDADADNLEVVLFYDAPQPLDDLTAGLIVKNHLQMPIFCVDNMFLPSFTVTAPTRRGQVVCRLERLPLMPGTYSLDLHLGTRGRHLDVVFDGMEEGLVARQLGERLLRVVVEVAVVLELAEERLQVPVLAQVRHPQEEVACVLVLGDRLERFDVLEPEPVHAGATGPARAWLRGAVYGVPSRSRASASSSS